MADSQTESQDKKIRARTRRRWNLYRWTDAMVDELFRIQSGKCAGCGRPPKLGGMSLNIDHYHFKIQALRVEDDSPNNRWYAHTVFPDGRSFHGYGPTKMDAVNTVREQALPQSVRGLLCPGRYRGCNRLLGRLDNPTLLRAFITYLEDPPAKKVLDKMRKL